MVLVPALLAAVVAAGPAAEPRASTYDQAACDDTGDEPDRDGLAGIAGIAGLHSLNALKGEPSDGDADCRQPAPPPAFLDCNDPLASVWVGDMIGTCDMPKSASPLARLPARLRAERPTLPQHRHSTVGTADDHAPLGLWSHPGGPDPALLSSTSFVHSQSRLPLGTPTTEDHLSPTAPRLDRPPRA